MYYDSISMFYFLEYNNTQNGLKCDSCSSWTDTECITPLSCVGIQECCFNMSGILTFFCYCGIGAKY